jgi:hypothetical protein
VAAEASHSHSMKSAQVLLILYTFIFCIPLSSNSRNRYCEMYGGAGMIHCMLLGTFSKALVHCNSQISLMSTTLRAVWCTIKLWNFSHESSANVSMGCITRLREGDALDASPTNLANSDRLPSHESIISCRILIESSRFDQLHESLKVSTSILCHGPVLPPSLSCLCMF